MIISASRRTDIPAFYSDWFFNRLKEGFVEVKNPFNSKVRSISLKPNDVDCIVFWTKNPLPMLGRLDELKDYEFYFQFTLNPYSRDIEPNVPSKGGNLINTFKELSDRIGKERLIWRYDPILITEKYSAQYHIEWFEKLAESLNGYFDSCTISFVDSYTKMEKRFQENGIRELSEEEMLQIAESFSTVSKKMNFTINTCAEKADLSRFGIGHACCIDRGHIEELTGRLLDLKRDKNQRPECGCCESVDIGVYNTCMYKCAYCYANGTDKTIEKNFKKHNASSACLI